MPPPAPKPSSPLVLIYGDDDFAVKQRARQVYQQWCQELGGMDHESLDAQVNNGGEALRVLGRLREALNTLPFFGTGKAVWLQNCNFLGDERAATSAAVTENLADLAQELKTFQWQNVRLLVSAGKIDKRKTFYKTIEKVGAIETYAAWSLDDKEWASEAESLALRMLKAASKDISDDALAELVADVGPNRRDLANEVEKLVLYMGGRVRVELDDIRAIITRHKQARAFVLADALGSRDLPRVLRTLDEELWEVKLDSQKSEIGLLYGLITKVRTMLFLREMQREGWIRPSRDYHAFKAQLERIPAEKLPQDKRFNPLAMNPYILFKALEHSGKYSSDELVAAMTALLQCNQRLVSSSLEAALVLQQTLVQIVRGQPTGCAVP